jgi:hypothetical protein
MRIFKVFRPEIRYGISHHKDAHPLGLSICEEGAQREASGKVQVHSELRRLCSHADPLKVSSRGWVEPCHGSSTIA